MVRERDREILNRKRDGEKKSHYDLCFIENNNLALRIKLMLALMQMKTVISFQALILIT